MFWEKEKQNNRHHNGKEPFHFNQSATSMFKELILTTPRKIHCQPKRPHFPSNFNSDDPRSGDTPVAPNIPKKNMAILLVNSAVVYHVESVYIAAGIYPASARPSSALVNRKPDSLRTNIWKLAIDPNMPTCALIH